jgi:hypothetical protein
MGMYLLKNVSELFSSECKKRIVITNKQTSAPSTARPEVTASQLFTNCSPTVPQLFTNSSPTVQQLFTNCSPTLHQLFTNCSPTLLLGSFAKLLKASISLAMSARPCVRLSARNNSTPTVRIFMKFDI